MLPQTTICASSEYFKAACSGRWTEGKKGVIKLPDFATTTFDAFLHYTYTNELDMTLITEDSSPLNLPTYEDLAKLWGIANYLQYRQLRNRVIDETLREMTRRPYNLLSSSALNAVYEIAPEGSTLRRLIEDFQLFRVTGFAFETQGKDWPLELIMAAARRYCNRHVRRSERRPTFDGRCKYHEHEDHESACTGPDTNPYRAVPSDTSECDSSSDSE